MGEVCFNQNQHFDCECSRPLSDFASLPQKLSWTVPVGPTLAPPTSTCISAGCIFGYIFGGIVLIGCIALIALIIVYCSSKDYREFFQSRLKGSCCGEHILWLLNSISSSLSCCRRRCPFWKHCNSDSHNDKDNAGRQTNPSRRANEQGDEEEKERMMVREDDTRDDTGAAGNILANEREVEEAKESMVIPLDDLNTAGNTSEA